MNSLVNKKNPITDGKLFPSLLKFTIPLILAILVQALYSTVDLIIVGQFGTKASVSAVAMGGQIMHTVIAIINGVAMGGTVLIGNLHGAKKFDKLKIAMGNLTSIGLILTILLTAIVCGCYKLITQALQVPVEAFDMCSKYILICGSGIVFTVVYSFVSAILRGLGNSKIPFWVVLISCIINVALDLIFVALLKMDGVGAAIATVIAQAFSVLLLIVIIKFKKYDFHLSKSILKFEKDTVTKLLKIGTPIALTDGLTSISFLVLSACVNRLGVVASASVGITERMFLFLIIVPMSFTPAISTFVAQNIGANKEKRAEHSFYIGIIISALFGLCIFFFCHFGGEIIAKMFTKDENVIFATQDYFKASSYEYLLSCYLFCFIGLFNGLGHTSFVMIENVLVAFAVRIPISWYFTQIPNVTMYKIGTSIPISSAVSLALCLIYFIFIIYKKRKKGSLLAISKGLTTYDNKLENAK